MNEFTNRKNTCFCLDVYLNRREIFGLTHAKDSLHSWEQNSDQLYFPQLPAPADKFQPWKKDWLLQLLTLRLISNHHDRNYKLAIFLVRQMVQSLKFSGLKTIFPIYFPDAEPIGSVTGFGRTLIYPNCLTIL